MKSGPIAAILAGLIVVCGIAYAFLQNGGQAISELPSGTAKASAEIVHVDDLAEHPETFKGEIVLRAAVAGVNESERVLSVIDSREFESCGLLTCAKHYLPVRFDGTLPAPRTVVEVTGEVVKNSKGLIFDATRVELVP